MSTEVATTNSELKLVQQTENVFSGSEQFALAQRQASALSASSIVPEAYRNSVPNCIVALEMSHRLGISPLMVMQNLYIVKGKPSWAGSFIIAMLNSCGRFSPLRFDMSGAGDKLQCRAYATDKATGDKLQGTLVTMAMVASEGWGSKWKTMPEQMMMYRSAAFFGRVYAPDILMGMQSVEEVQDITDPTPPVDKDLERVMTMIGDCDTIERLTALQAKVPEKYKMLVGDAIANFKK